MSTGTIKGLNLHAGGKTENRRELDFYPTPPDVTHALMAFLGLPKFYTAWDPACGDNAMVNVIKEYVSLAVGTDIITGDDFFKTKKRVDAIITNPPFALSEQFILRSLDMADTVCMLLKSQYWHAQRRISLFRDNKPAFVLPLTWRPDFMNGERGGRPTMEVCWTVWIKGETETRYIPLERAHTNTLFSEKNTTP